jgi:hypothetical protein
MANYIQFSTEDKGEILIEVEESELASPTGVVKAGLGEKVQESLVKAQATFDQAFERVINVNAQALIQAIAGLPKPPSKIELNFGIKATGEAGNFAIARVSGDANFSIKLVWNSQSTENR